MAPRPPQRAAADRTRRVPVPPEAGRRPGRSTGRLVILAVLVGGLLLSAALPLREYLAQRGEIQAVQAEQAEQRARVAALTAERARLQDPAYVAAEARRRLNFVLPGETAYVLIEPSAAPGARDAVGGDSPWYTQLWGTARAADRPTPAPSP